MCAVYTAPRLSDTAAAYCLFYREFFTSRLNFTVLNVVGSFFFVLDHSGVRIKFDYREGLWKISLQSCIINITDWHTFATLNFKIHSAVSNEFSEQTAGEWSQCIHLSYTCGPRYTVSSRARPEELAKIIQNNCPVWRFKFEIILQSLPLTYAMSAFRNNTSPKLNFELHTITMIHISRFAHYSSWFSIPSMRIPRSENATAPRVA